MIVNEIINVRIHTKNIKDFPNTKIGDLIDTSVYKLSNGSKVKINIKCDNCGVEKISPYGEYVNATKNHTRKYYCIKCKYIHSENTLMEKYGVKNVMHLDSVKKTHNDAVNSVDFIEADRKRKITVKDKYGVEYVQQNKEINKKTSETVEKIYGEKYVFLTKENRDKSILASSTEDSKLFRKYNLKIKYSNELKKIGLNLIDYDGYNYFIKCEKEHVYEITDTLLYTRNKFNKNVCTICNPISSCSESQKELLSFIKSLYYGEIINNIRSIIEPYEIDIYLPEIKLAFEFNGVYWHSDKFKDDKYHITKYKMCKKLGIDLINIWEDDWVNNKELIKELVKKKLGITPSNKIYARKCFIKNISIEEEKDFLTNYHLQGYTPSSYKYGLYYNNDLVSILTFSKRYIKKDSDYDIELLRYAIKTDYAIVGGIEKLFKHFLNNTDFKIIKTYSEPSYFNGNVYSKLGFEYKHLSEPSFFLMKRYKRLHREYLLKNKEENLTKIWDLGQHVFYYTKKNL